MMKAAFKTCALIAGLIERRFTGERKSARQITFSTDLVYDVLRRHQGDHLLLRCARADAARGLVDVARLGDMLKRIAGRILHKQLDQLSPFSVAVILEIGRQRSPGEGAGERILIDAAETLIAEALHPYPDDLTYRDGLEAGKKKVFIWDLASESVDIHRAGETVVVKKIEFIDASDWIDDGSEACVYKVDFHAR